MLNRMKNLEKMQKRTPQDVREIMDIVGGIKYANIWN